VKAESGMIRALRTLRNEPGFALSSVFTRALGIGCSSAMFIVFYAVLLAPVPYADPLRVVAIHTRSNTTGRRTTRLRGGDWSDLAASIGIFETLARYHGGQVGVQLHNRAEWAWAYWVSPTFFQVFDAAPVRGRSFTEADRNGRRWSAADLRAAYLGMRRRPSERWFGSTFALTK
jgi:hypothetical protein